MMNSYHNDSTLVSPSSNWGRAWLSSAPACHYVSPLIKVSWVIRFNILKLKITRIQSIWIFSFNTSPLQISLFGYGGCTGVIITRMITRCVAKTIIGALRYRGTLTIKDRYSIIRNRQTCLSSIHHQTNHIKKVGWYSETW